VVVRYSHPPKAASTPNLRESPPGGQEHFLDDVLGVASVGQHPCRQSEHRRLVSVQQPLECADIALPGAGNQRGVIQP